MTPLVDRLTRAMNSMSPVPTYADLARAAGIRPASVSNWFSGKTKSLGKALLPVSKFLNVNPDWLATGKGAMRGPFRVEDAPLAYGESQPQRLDPAMISLAVRAAHHLRDTSLESMSDETFVEVLAIAIQAAADRGEGASPADVARDIAAAFRKRA